MLSWKEAKDEEKLTIKLTEAAENLYCSGRNAARGTSSWEPRLAAPHRSQKQRRGEARERIPDEVRHGLRCGTAHRPHPLRAY